MKYAIIKYDGFDWDHGNLNKISSRVPTAAVEALFKGPVLYKLDLRHSFNEVRFIAVGYTSEPKRCLFVAFTVRQKDDYLLIRPISARFTHKKEEDAYEKQIKKIQEG